MFMGSFGNACHLIRTGPPFFRCPHVSTSSQETPHVLAFPFIPPVYMSCYVFLPAVEYDISLLL